MKHRLQRNIEANWSDISKEPKPGKVEFILLYKTFLVFNDKQKSPCIVIKYSCDDSLEYEFNNLRKINKLLQDETPEPYFYKKFGHYYILAEGFKHGTQVSKLYLTKNLVQSIFQSLIKFHKASYKGNFYFDNHHMDEMVVSPFSQFLKINSSKLFEREIKQLLDSVNQMKGYALPYIPQHSDFCLGNILFDQLSKRLYIIDWADFGKTYFPLYDAFLFIISYYFHPEKFSGFLEDSVINNAFIEGLNLYLKHFEIDKRWVRILFLISLITFFNQNYPERKKAWQTLKDLIMFSFKNKQTMFFNKLF